MLRKPWQLCDPNLAPQKCEGAYIGINKAVVSNMTREYFFSQLPWWENAEARFSNNGEFMYPGGVFQLRAHKLQIMKQVMDIFRPHTAPYQNRTFESLRIISSTASPTCTASVKLAV